MVPIPVRTPVLHAGVGTISAPIFSVNAANALTGGCCLGFDQTAVDESEDTSEQTQEPPRRGGSLQSEGIGKARGVGAGLMAFRAGGNDLV